MKGKIKTLLNKKFNSKLLIYGHLKKYKSILDVACGKESILKGLDLNAQSVGIDFYKPYIKKSKKEKIHNKYIYHDITKRFPFKENSFDVAICTEVLEHLDKKDGLGVIKEMVRVSKKEIIFTTPNGLTQDMEPSEGDNPAEKHISGWQVNEIKKIGFIVKGLHGFKFLRNDSGEIRHKPKNLFKIISFLSKPIAYYLPKTAHQLYFYKKLK